MDRLYNYILTILWTSEEEETKRLLTEQKPTNKRTINVFIFVFFIVTITFYATINLLMMSAVILLFVYWILQVQVFSVHRLKMNRETRAPLYFNQVQRLLQRHKVQDALEVYLQYTMRDEDSDNIKLYLITLFHNRKWDDIIHTMQRHNVENKDIQTMYKFSLLQSNQFDILQPLLENTDLDYIMLQSSRGDRVDPNKINDPELGRLAQRL